MEKWEDVNKRMNSDINTLSKSIIIGLIVLTIVVKLATLFG